MYRRVNLRVASLAVALAWIGSAGAQSPPAPQSAGLVQADPLAALTAEQKTRFHEAAKRFAAGDYAGALPMFRELSSQLQPGTSAQIVVAKYASESALNMGDRDYAFSLLKPIVAAAPDDWQALSLMVRAYAETGQKAQRDATLAHLMDLHRRGVSPQLTQMQQFLMERIATKNGSIRIWYSFVPWGNFKTYVFSRIYDASGQQVLRVTLESSDFDQPQFAKEHPDMAAKGMRRFSMDGYGQDKKLDNGQVSQTHMTFGFFDGEPSYDVVRDRIVAIAEKQVGPISSMTPGK